MKELGRSRWVQSSEQDAISNRAFERETMLDSDMESEGKESRVASGDVIATDRLSIDSPAGKPIVKDLSISIGPGCKLAIIGAEGVGKSTLLRILAGQDVASFSVKGEVRRGDAGYLAQSLDPEWLNQEAVEFFLKDSPCTDIPLERWNRYSDMVKSLTEVGLDADFVMEERSLGTFSGGELVRLRIAKLLFDDPNILLLDEPTNHLDLETVRWLEQFIVESKKPIVFVSHDEMLIERAATSLLHMQHTDGLNECRHTYTSLGYREFLESRKREIDRSVQLADAEKRERRKARIRLAELENKAKGKSRRSKGHDLSTKNRAAHGQKKSSGRSGDLLSKIKAPAKYKKLADDEAIKLDFPDSCTIPNGKSVLDASIEELVIEDKLLSRNLKLFIAGPEKVVLVGANGVGKSTLIRQVKMLLENYGSSDIRVGYLPQKYDELFSGVDVSALDFLLAVNLDQTLCRTVLARMGFTTDETLANINDLSGGQKAKLLLSRMVLKGANVLILDEPTTNLSPLSAGPLREFLKGFPGAVIAVSHDRGFIHNVATKVYKMTPTGLQPLDLEAV